MTKKRSYKTFIIVVSVAIALFMLIFYLVIRPTWKQLNVEADVNSLKTYAEDYRLNHPLSSAFSSEQAKIIFSYPDELAVSEDSNAKTINIYQVDSDQLTDSLIFFEMSENRFQLETDSYSLHDFQDVLLAGAPAVRADYLVKTAREGLPQFANHGHSIILVQNPRSSPVVWYAIHLNPEVNEEMIGMVLESIGYLN